LKTIASILLTIISAHCAVAQTIYVPNQDIGNSSNTNVGIGTGILPAEKLEVAGNVRISGAGGNYHSQLLFYRSDGVKFASIGQANLGATNSTFDIQHFNGNDIRFLNNGVERLRINSSGIVGIGTANPSGTFGEKLHIYSDSNTGLKVERSNGVIGSFLSYSDQVLMGSASNHSLSLITGGNTRVIVRETGSVGIGMVDPNLIDAKLTVAGDIHSREVRVTIDAGSDFVFLDNYTLPTLAEVEKFIGQHKHLPGVASAAEMEKEGVELGKMDMKLLQKIEELTLYMIELKKEIDEVKNENKDLRDKMSELKKN
jgi:hypothetical protein